MDQQKATNPAPIPTDIGGVTNRELQEVRNLDYELPCFHPGKTPEEMEEIKTNMEEKYARLALPLGPNSAVEGEYMRVGGKDDSRYVVLRDSKKREFRIWLTGQLAYKFDRELSIGDWVRVTYLGKSEEPIEVEVDGKKKKVHPHNFKVEAARENTH